MRALVVALGEHLGGEQSLLPIFGVDQPLDLLACDHEWLDLATSKQTEESADPHRSVSAAEQRRHLVKSGQLTSGTENLGSCTADIG
jgi:hypothetical protein